MTGHRILPSGHAGCAPLPITRRKRLAAHDGVGHDKYFDIKCEQNVSFYTPVENMGYAGRVVTLPPYALQTFRFE